MSGTVKSEMPVVSICIPIYNGYKYIGETIHSILKQEYPRVEIVVQDNASDDGTWEILEQLASEYSNIYIERNKENIGAVGNWNRVIDRGSGDYVMWLSGDDLLEPGFITKCVEVFQNENVDVVTTNFYFLEHDEKKIRSKKVSAGIYRHFYGKLLRSPMLFTINFTVFTKDILNKMRIRGNVLVNQKFTFDYDLWLRLSLIGAKVYYVEDPFGTYRIHDTNMSKQRKRLRRLTIMAILRNKKALNEACHFSYKAVFGRYILRLLRPSTFDKRLLQILCGELRR